MGGGGGRRKTVMFLVDFDNVSPEVIEQAFEMSLHDYGAIHVRRAYCTADQAQQNAGFLKRFSLRPMVNLAVGKNSTDIALAVDAMDLVIAERPDIVVIVSSDSDYTPLVGRLREKGAWLRGFGQQGKTSDGVQAAYDQYNDIAHRDAKAAARQSAAQKAPSRGQAKAVAAESPRASPAAPVKPAAKAAPAVKPATKRSPARKAAAVVAAPAPAPAKVQAPSPQVAASPVPKPAPMPALQFVFPPEIEAILQAVPSLRSGEKVQLGEAAQALRQADLLAKTTASTRLFKQHIDYFVLSPDRQPNKVQFIATKP